MPQQAVLGIKQPAATAGIQKALQAFVTVLLTPKGSSWNPSVGSWFIVWLKTGMLRSPIDVVNAFNSEVDQLLATVNQGAETDDETLTSVDISDVVLHHDRISFKLTFQNKSQNVTYISTTV